MLDLEVTGWSPFHLLWTERFNRSTPLRTSRHHSARLSCTYISIANTESALPELPRNQQGLGCWLWRVCLRHSVRPSCSSRLSGDPASKNDTRGPRTHVSSRYCTQHVLSEAEVMARFSSLVLVAACSSDAISMSFEAGHSTA